MTFFKTMRELGLSTFSGNEAGRLREDKLSSVNSISRKWYIKETENKISLIYFLFRS